MIGYVLVRTNDLKKLAPLGHVVKVIPDKEGE